MSSDLKFGWSKGERVSYISERLKYSDKTRTEEYEGKIQDLKIIKVPIELLLYRIENIRTNCAQMEYCEKNSNISISEFRDNKESIKTQQAQHAILLSMVNDEKLFDEFKTQNEKGQTDSLIITPDGIVVNGNRRLCAWRELYYSNPTKYSYFEMIEVAVLPDSNEEKIKDLEYRLQIRRDMRSDYAWYARALAFKQDLAMPGIDTEIIKKKKGIDPNEVTTLIAEYDLAEQYLIKINKKNHWSLLNEERYSFEQIVKLTKKYTDEYNPMVSEVLKDISFSIVLANHEKKITEKTGRLYEFIPNIGTFSKYIIEDIKDKLVPEEFKKEREKAPSSIPDEVIVGKLLGKIENSVLANNVVHTVNARIDIEKEKKNKKVMLDELRKVNTVLSSCYTSDKSEQSKKGVKEEIKKAKFYLENIEKWCDE